MIFGTGCDLVQISRFEKWVKNPDMLSRFFSEKEIAVSLTFSDRRKQEYFASRFAAKEAFGKALGTGLAGIMLKDISVCKNQAGKPYIVLEGDLEEKFRGICGKNAAIHLSVSHEKEYALADVIIETL